VVRNAYKILIGKSGRKRPFNKQEYRWETSNNQFLNKFHDEM